MNLTCLKSGIWQAELRIPVEVRPVIGKTRFAKSTGTLQLLDSQIMEEAVHRATEKGIPVLPVHDELVGPVSKKTEIKQILIDSFHEVTQGKFSTHQPKMTWSTT